LSNQLAFQFKDTFVKHFNPHQFGVVTLSGHETMVHGVKVMLDLHLKWVVLHVDVWNAFNLIFQASIFQELQFSIDILDQLFPFVRRFYARPFPLYFLKVSRHGDLTIISFEFGTWHGDPLGGMLFALAHLCIVCPIVIAHLTCIFLLLAYDMYIVGPTSDVFPIFLWLQE
jgi:hypothetical protein